MMGQIIIIYLKILINYYKSQNQTHTQIPKPSEFAKALGPALNTILNSIYY